MSVSQFSKKEIKELIELCYHEKKAVIDYGFACVEAEIVELLRATGVPAENYKASVKVFESDKEGNFIQNFAYAYYYGWDSHPSWQEDFENDYMILKGWKYESPTPSTLGCIAKLMSHCKNERVKQLNKRGGRMHGNKIRLQRLKDEVTDKKKAVKRKKGEPNPEGTFVIIGGGRSD